MSKQLAFDRLKKLCRELGPDAPDHECGPEGNCDHGCMVYASFVELLDSIEREFADDAIEYLRKDEGDWIAIPSDNKDPGSEIGCYVDCSGGWTMWRTRRFEGTNLAKALEAARAAKEHAHNYQPVHLDNDIEGATHE